MSTDKKAGDKKAQGWGDTGRGEASEMLKAKVTTSQKRAQSKRVIS